MAAYKIIICCPVCSQRIRVVARDSGTLRCPVCEAYLNIQSVKDGFDVHLLAKGEAKNTRSGNRHGTLAQNLDGTAPDRALSPNPINFTQAAASLRKWIGVHSPKYRRPLLAAVLVAAVVGSFMHYRSAQHEEQHVQKLWNAMHTCVGDTTRAAVEAHKTPDFQITEERCAGQRSTLLQAKCKGDRACEFTVLQANKDVFPAFVRGAYSKIEQEKRHKLIETSIATLREQGVDDDDLRDVLYDRLFKEDADYHE